MEPWVLYKRIIKSKYNKSGFDLDWKVEVDTDERKVRLLFKSSNSTKDWIVNIGGFLPILRFPFMFTSGWKIVFDNAKSVIMKELTSAIEANKDFAVEICGHSYGGAQSIIAGIELYKTTKIKADIITFGCPKPLFLFTSKLISKKYFNSVVQYAHYSDCVTYCPPFPGYWNVKQQRLGKFSLKGLSDPETYHLIYGDSSIY